jgi:prolyl-tRNA synthetase
LPLKTTPRARFNCWFRGPQGLVEKGLTVIVDRAASVLSDFIAGANEVDKHATGVNWERDAQFSEVYDLT